MIRGSGTVKISGNNLGGSLKLNGFTMSLKWSKIGSLRMYLVQVLFVHNASFKLENNLARDPPIVNS